MKIVTKVTFTKRFEKELKVVPVFIQKKVFAWIWAVQYLGLRDASRANGLHDEPLLGQRWGQRSIRLNRSYRLVYRIIDEQVHIEILEVHKHDY